MNKRADITAEQIVTVVLLVAAFAIILFVYWQFNWTGTVNKESCHNSVLLKASTPSLVEKKLLDLPLRCKTSKACITMSSKGTCDKFRGASSSEVSRIIVKDKTDINRAVANLLYDCWWMMGEGKVDIFPREFQLSRYSVRCVECASIDFAQDVKDKYPEGIPGIQQFLLTQNIPKSSSKYYEFLAPGLETPPYDKTIASRDLIYANQPLSVMFLEYDLFNTPSLTVRGVLDVAGGIAAEYYLSKFIGQTGVALLLGAFDQFVSAPSGRLVGGLFGKEHVFNWALLPSDIGSSAVNFQIIDGSTLKSFGKTPNEEECYATKRDSGEIYGIKKDDPNFYIKSGDTWEKLTVSDSNDDPLSKIASELYIACNDISSISCSWESYA